MELRCSCLFMFCIAEAIWCCSSNDGPGCDLRWDWEQQWQWQWGCTVYPKTYAHGFCFVVVIHWLIFPYPSGLLHWHCGNLTIAPVPAKQPWWIWINTSCEFIMDWSGLDLFIDDTCPSGHISRPAQVNVSQSCFNSLNILPKLNYIAKVWGLVEVNCVISDRRIPLLAGIQLCKSRELSRRGYSKSQLCRIHHDIPVTLHTPVAYGQWSVFDLNGDK